MSTFAGFIPIILILFIISYFIFIRKYQKKAKEKVIAKGKRFTALEKVVAALFLGAVIWASVTNDEIKNIYIEIFKDPELFENLQIITIIFVGVVIMVWLYRKINRKQ